MAKLLFMSKKTVPVADIAF